MKNSFVYIFIAICITFAGISSCSVGNKEIPNPTGNQIVDTSGMSTINLDVSGDTSYSLHLKIYADTVVNSVLLVSGTDYTTQDSITFATLKDTVGVYIPNLPNGLFVFSKKQTSGHVRYPLTQGSISITQRDTSTRIYQGVINVNNNNISGQPHYTVSGNFVVKN